jgi:hypothetical protein
MTIVEIFVGRGDRAGALEDEINRYVAERGGEIVNVSLSFRTNSDLLYAAVVYRMTPKGIAEVMK